MYVVVALPCSIAMSSRSRT